MITVQRKVHFRQGRRTRKELAEGEKAPATAPGRVPRVSQLTALAIRFDQLIRDGVVADQAELARLTQTQVDLNCLRLTLRRRCTRADTKKSSWAYRKGLRIA